MLNLITSQFLSKAHANFVSYLVEIIVLFLICLWFLSVRCKISMKMNKKEFKQDSIKTLEYILCTDEKACDKNSQSDSQLLVSGLIKLHEKVPCSNEKCFIFNSQHEYEHYESDSLQLSSGSNENVQKLKLLLKCLYEIQMKNDPTNVEAVINFLEFLYNQLKN